MLLPIPSSPPGVVVKDDTTSASAKYPVFASVVNGQVVYEGVSSTKLYYTPSTGVLNATGFAGAGTGLTGTASGLSIGGNAATATLAASATNLAGGLANQLPVQTASGVTSFIGAPSTSGSFLQWTVGGGFAWTSFNGVTSFSAGTTGFTPSTSTTGAVTLAGTLNAANGGTGANTLTGYVYGNGTGAMTAATTIPNTAITGLGTMSTQNANAVAITGGNIDGTVIGGTTAAAGSFTTVGIGQYATYTAQSSSPTYVAGRVWFDSTTSSLSYYNDATNNVVRVGTQLQQQARNSTGSTITKGSVVYISGSTGQIGNIILAQANAYTTSQVIGIAAQDIPNNANGYIVIYGTVEEIDTSTLTAGNNIYLSAATAGALTQTEPSTPNYAVHMGVCLYSNANHGKLLIVPQNKSIDTGYVIGKIAIAQGGTNSTATPSAGTVAYGNGTAYAFTAAGTTGQVFTSAGTGAPTWTSQSALSVGSATTATTATTASALGTTNWTVAEVAGKLTFSYGGVAKFSLDSSGNAIAAGDVSGGGTP